MVKSKYPEQLVPLLLFISKTAEGKQPHWVDAPDILFFPSGLHFRYFRYRKYWISDKFADKGYEQLIGKRALLGFRHMDDIFPLRWVVIDSIDKRGDFLFVRFKTDNLILYSKNKTSSFYSKLTRDGISVEDREKLLLSVRLPSDPKVGIEECDEESKIDAWTAIVDQIGKMEPFDNTIFFFIMDVWDKEGNVKLTPSVIDKKSGELGYYLPAGRTYSMKFLQVFPAFIGTGKRFDSFKMKLSVIAEHIFTLKDFVEINANYDMHELVFHSRSLRHEAGSVIGLQVPREEEIPFYVPSIFIPIRIKVSWALILRELGGPIFLFSFGIFLSGLSSIVWPYSWLVAGVGAILSALGLWWLRQRL